MMRSRLQKFSATIYRLGINFCVDVPETVSKAFGKRGYVPVAGRLNHLKIRATLVPRGGGRHRVFLNGEMRRAAGVGEGDRVTLLLKRDTRSREVPAPDEFRKALRRKRGAVSAFEACSPSHRKEILVWILDAKHAETRARRIAKAINHLLGLTPRR